MLFRIATKVVVGKLIYRLQVRALSGSQIAIKPPQRRALLRQSTLVGKGGV